jgi:putative transposase
LDDGVKGLGEVVRVCLHQGATPVFIPPREPWRNGSIEHFNDTFDSHLFRTEHFPAIDRLIARSIEFETFHNANHRYSALRGATPDEYDTRTGFRPRVPIPGTRPAPTTGKVEFIRMIRSDRKLRILDLDYTLPETVVHEYVVAAFDLAEQKLTVLHHGEPIAQHPCPLRL